MKIFIDPGHGGSDSGAVECGLVERDINLVTSLSTKEVLERHGVQVKMSRYDNSTYVGLSERCRMANEWGADLFVSEHENAGGGDRGEAIHSIYHGVGDILANNVAEELKVIGQTQVKNYSREGTNGNYYAVIRETKMPALISEGCFLDNEVDNDIIDTIAEQKIMGMAIAKGILKTLGIAYIDNTPIPQPTTTIWYRVLIDGKNLEANRTQEESQRIVKAKIDNSEGTLGQVQRSDNNEITFTYTKPVVITPPVVDPPIVVPPVIPTPIKHPIISKSNSCIEQMKAWAKVRNASDKFIELATLFYKIGTKLGINPEGVYAQSGKETNFGRFGEVLDESYCNPCGLKITIGGGDKDATAHKRFDSWEDGITAMYDHIALYSGLDGYPKANTLDPRHFTYLFGEAKNFEDLSGKWCPEADYGEEIVKLTKELLSTVYEVNLPKPKQEETKENFIDKLIIWFVKILEWLIK